MKSFKIHGLALALSLAMTVPGFAQYGQNIWNQTEGQTIGSSQSTPIYPASHLRYRQDQDSPSDAVTPGAITPQGDTPAPMDNSIVGQTNPSNAVYGDSVVNGGACADGSCGVDVGGGANWIGGVYGLGFYRDYEDDLGLSYSTAPGQLLSTDADNDLMGGVEVMIGRRGCNGLGWELGYWGLYPSQTDTTLAGNPDTVLFGLSYVTEQEFFTTVQATYNSAGDHRIYRNNEFHNVELNLLTNGGNTGRHAIEWIAGFRWFEFDEFFRYRTSTTNAGYPPVFDYDINVQNTLLGFQMGGRKEICLGSRLRLHLGAKAGIFNNHVRHRQLMQNPNTGVIAQINQGPFVNRVYDYSSTKNDIAMLGELDLGLSYQFSSCWRIRGGYRAVGVSGVALAPYQVPRNFSDGNEIQRINSNGSLILNGFYVGGEFCF